jgi:teichuronic acid biosynthesis glycosyltransferase TuaC
VRVLTLSTIYPNEKNDSVGRSVAFLDQALAKAGVLGVTLFLRPWAPVFLAKRVNRWQHLALRNRAEKRNGFTVVFDQYLHLPRRYRLDLSAWFMASRANRLIERNGWHFDLIHGQSIFPAGIAAHLLSRQHRVPFIITLRDHLSHLEDMLTEAGPSFPRLVEGMFHRVNGILVHGPAILRDLSRYLPEKTSIPFLLAPNGADVEGIESILASLPPPPPHGWGHIVSVGNLFRFKGIHENLRALKMVDERGVRDWHYTIVGLGPFRQELDRLSTEIGLKGRVTFAGGVSHREAIRIIRDGDIFCLPSWEEPFGNVYAEAAVCGRAAIGCRGFGAELTIRDGETGMLVPPRDIPALAEALYFLLTHPERAREMGDEAQGHIRQFTWDRTARIYRETMVHILSERISP